MRAQRLDDRLASVAKPEIEPIDSLPLGSSDCVIVCCGFEERCLGVPRVIERGKATRFHVLGVRYLPTVQQNRDSEVEQVSRGMDARWQDFTYDRHNPDGAGDAISCAVGELGGRVYIDISGMSRLLVVQIIVALARLRKSFANISIVYTEAGDYPPSQESVTKAIKEQTDADVYRGMFLSEGVIGVITVPELSSVALQGQPLRLVAFPSFNTDQLSALKLELQPAAYTVVHGNPPFPENSWRPEAIRTLNQIEALPHREEKHASTLHYGDTLALLLDTYRAHGDLERLVIAPTGSKMQSVAIGIFRTFMEDVRIAYPVSRDYVAPTVYTKGIRQVYHLPLDAFSEVWSDAAPADRQNPVP